MAEGEHREHHGEHDGHERHEGHEHEGQGEKHEGHDEHRLEPGREASGRRHERRGGVHESTAEREGIVDQQDAALEAIEEVQGGDDGDPMAGPAPTG